MPRREGESIVETRPQTTLGPVTLLVPDLGRSVEFYRTALGLKPRRVEGHTAGLGVGGEDLLVLEETSALPSPRRSTGLYHFAILLPSRPALARQLRHFVAERVPLQGMADHLVSEAIYLADPDGNGIEVYRDRPRREWIHDGDMLRMATDPLDADGLLTEPEGSDEPWTGMPPGTVMGHVHLRVSDLDEAETFYRKVLGLDVTTRYGEAASFLSSGGYHHHVGLNSWTSRGAPPPPAGAPGLRHFEFRASSHSELERIRAAAERFGLPAEALSQGLLLRDPSANRVLVVSP